MSRELLNHPNTNVDFVRKIIGAFIFGGFFFQAHRRSAVVSVFLVDFPFFFIRFYFYYMEVQVGSTNFGWSALMLKNLLCIVQQGMTIGMQAAPDDQFSVDGGFKDSSGADEGMTLATSYRVHGKQRQTFRTPSIPPAPSGSRPMPQASEQNLDTSLEPRGRAATGAASSS